MHLAVRIKGMAGFLAGWLAAASPGLVLGQTGPVLPPQGPQVINELTTLVVKNTAVETNIPPGQQFATVIKTNHFTFSYPNRDALLTDDWSFMASRSGTNRNTEITNSAQGLLIDYNQAAHPGSINIPCDLGDMWDVNDETNRVYPTRNLLSRALSPTWTEINLTITWDPGMVAQQAGLAIYQDDDNFLLNTLGYATWRPSHDWTGGTDPYDREACVWVYGGSNAVDSWQPLWSPHVHCYDLNGWQSGHTFTLRWERFITGASSNCAVAYWFYMPGVFGDTGDQYNFTGSYPTAPLVLGPRVAIWTGCDPPATPGAVNMVLNSFEIISLEPAITLTYSLLNAPAGASISANGIITWTPASGQFPSTNLFTTVVTDNSVPPVSATNSFTVIVQQVNAAPALAPQADRTISILDTLTVTNTATEVDPAATLSYQLQDPSPGATLSSNGIITWTPGIGQQFTTNVFVTVATSYDPQAVNGQSLSTTNRFSVAVFPPSWPVLPNQPARTVTALTTLTVTNTAVDGALTVNQMGTNAILFNYADRATLLADGWSFMGTTPINTARNTETAAGAGVVDYNQGTHPGVLNIPCDVGDLYGTNSPVNNTRNTLFRSLPADWQSVRLALSFAPVAADYQQAHLGLYQNDDNYVQMGVAYNHWDTSGNPRFTLDNEIEGFPATPAKTPTTSTMLNFRLDRNPINSTVTAYFSLDGATWTVLGTTALTLPNCRLMIWTGGAQTAYAGSGAIMSLRQLDITGGTPVPTVLSYALISPPSGATIDNNGIITWTPGAATPAGPYVLTTVATDNGLPPLSVTNSFTVTVLAPSPPPAIKSVTLQNGQIVMSWDAVPSQGYRLQYCDNLRSTHWEDVTPDVTALGATLTITNTLDPSPSRFFRILMLP
jgi:hypothetical protein